MGVADINKACDELSLNQRKAQLDEVQINLSALKMKEVIRADLKMSGFHRDLIRFIRSSLRPSPHSNAHASESEVLQVYRHLLEKRLRECYETTLEEDLKLLEEVENAGAKYHWMYQYVLIYRIGQKQILSKQIALCGLVEEQVKAYLENGTS